MAERSQDALATVLDFLFAAHIEASDAFGAAKALLEAGVRTRDDLAALTPERAKLLSALRKMPTLDNTPTPPSSKKQRQTADLPATPPPPSPPPSSSVGCDADVVLNRSPVMVLWATAIAFVLGHAWADALSLGSACAAMFARSKGKSLGLYATGPSHAASADGVWLLGKCVPTQLTADGVRGLSDDKHREGVVNIVQPSAVHRTMAAAYGVHLAAAWHAMLDLVRAVPALELVADGNRMGFDLYVKFRPDVPAGLAGWGQPGRLRLRRLLELRNEVRGSAVRANGPPAAASDVKAEEDERATGMPHSPAATESSAQLGLLGEIEQRRANGGAKLEELATALRTDESEVRQWVEALQADGAVYESAEGRLLPL